MNIMNPKKTVSAILESGLTQAQLALMVPCAQSSISYLATGKRGKRISKFVGDRLEQIYEERCAPKPPRRTKSK